MRLLIELIQVSLGSCQKMSKVPSVKEWQAVFDEAEYQSVVGVCLAGIERLMASKPEQMVNLPIEIKLEWIGLSEQIRQQNKYVDKKTAKIWRQLKADGLETAILKGQGIAAMYDVRGKKEDVKDSRPSSSRSEADFKENHSGKYENLGELRQPGDIDIWVKGGYDTVCDYVQRTHPTEDVAYHRFHYDYFEDTEVELHHRPTLMRNLMDDRKLARWYNSFGADSFEYLEDKGFAIPPVEFNRIFILTHIYRHFLFEGIGLRQVMDYYFVLKANRGKDKEEVAKILKKLRLVRFAEAVMWILHTQLGLEEKYLICSLNEKEGRFVLSEIEQTGNFGFSDTRYQYKRLFKLRRQVAHGAHLLVHYPSEVIWTPIWLLYHWFWKKVKIYNIKRIQKNE